MSKLLIVANKAKHERVSTRFPWLHVMASKQNYKISCVRHDIKHTLRRALPDSPEVTKSSGRPLFSRFDPGRQPTNQTERTNLIPLHDLEVRSILSGGSWARCAFLQRTRSENHALHLAGARTQTTSNAYTRWQHYRRRYRQQHDQATTFKVDGNALLLDSWWQSTKILWFSVSSRTGKPRRSTYQGVFC